MSDPLDVLIVGSGPTGLSAALFLSERAGPLRIIDKAPGPAQHSRAQVINPRSLELLERSGVTRRVLEEGRPFKGVRFYDGWAPLAQLEFSDIHPRFPMVALPQALTEALLAEALDNHGIRPEFGVALEAFSDHGTLVEARLRQGNAVKTQATRLLLAADGAHSTVREQLGITFDGSAFPEPWPLYDIRLDTPIDPDYAHVSFVAKGLVFFLQIGAGTWRVFGDVPEPLDSLPSGTRPGEILWRSEFHVSHRLAATETVGRVVLAGDAAHIHSPAAARGMNLGIEDAYAFALAAPQAADGRLDVLSQYGRSRHTVHRTVVNRVETLTYVGRGQPGVVGLLRKYGFPLVTRFGPSARTVLSLLTGLDHPSPALRKRVAV